MPQRAKLDHDGVYWGAEEVDALADADAPVPDDVIRPGAYRWVPAGNGLPGHFAPLAPSQVKKIETAPSLEQAVYALVTQGAADPRVSAWVKAHEASLDAAGGAK